MTIFKYVAVIILLSCREIIAGSPPCGNLNLEAFYGKQSSFVSTNLNNVKCKYLIRAPTGLHVKLTFSKFFVLPEHTNFTVYDATGRKFKWKPKRVLANTDDMLRPGEERIFETHIIGIEYEKAVAHPIRFEYSATAPSSKNCGFDKYASDKKKVIHTPGFKSTKLESGLRCTWNIRSEGGSKPVQLYMKSLKTASDQDYVEIRDGDEVLERLSGKLKKKTYMASSGHLQIYLHTETSKSKGFKFTYQTMEVKPTTPPEPESTGSVTPDVIPEPEGGIRCYDMMDVKSVGWTLPATGKKEEKVCAPNSECLRLEAVATHDLYPSVKITTIYGACIPNVACKYMNCDSLPRTMADVTMESCDVSCCDTDLCNE